MKFCLCTIPQTNPNACKYCPNNEHNEFQAPVDWWKYYTGTEVAPWEIVIENPYNPEKPKVFDPPV